MRWQPSVRISQAGYRKPDLRPKSTHLNLLPDVMNGSHCATSERGEIGSQFGIWASQVGHIVLSTIVHGFDPVWSTIFI